VEIIGTRTICRCSNSHLRTRSRFTNHSARGSPSQALTQVVAASVSVFYGETEIDHYSPMMWPCKLLARKEAMNFEPSVDVNISDLNIRMSLNTYTLGLIHKICIHLVTFTNNPNSYTPIDSREYLFASLVIFFWMIFWWEDCLLDESLMVSSYNELAFGHLHDSTDS